MTKERLRNYQRIKDELVQIHRQVEEIEAALLHPKVQKLTGMPSAPSHGNATENMIAKHLELLEWYKYKEAELASEQLAIEQAIEDLEQRERMLLRYRYIDGLTWEQVCIAMGYEWAQTHRIHGKALEQLREMEGKE